MPDPRKLPHLIRLLDDDSPLVKNAVWRELQSFGPTLEEELERQDLAIEADRLQEMRSMRDDLHRSALLNRWPSWIELKDEKDQLERAFNLLTDFQEEYAQPGRLTTLLDELAREFYETEADFDSRELARFLFQTQGLAGCQTDYYHSDKSNLARVIDRRSGNPISLTCIYMLVGHRLGIEIQGCNFPGHFLARTLQGCEVLLVDCFNGGQCFKAQAFRDLNPDSGLEVREIVYTPASVQTILNRVLNNLANAYDLAEQQENSALMRRLVQIQRHQLEHEDPHL